MNFIPVDIAQGLGWAFAVSNTARAVFYVPQIRAIARSNDGARDIALPTWWMWLVNNLLGTGYCSMVLGDVPLACSFLASLTGCACLIWLTARQRRRCVCSVEGSICQGADPHGRG